MATNVMSSGNKDKVLSDSKSLVELFTRLNETLSKAASKNESLLEAIESSQARASEAGNATEVSKLESRRSSLALCRVYCRCLSYGISELVWQLSTLPTLN